MLLCILEFCINTEVTAFVFVLKTMLSGHFSSLAKLNQNTKFRKALVAGPVPNHSLSGSSEKIFEILYYN